MEKEILELLAAANQPTEPFRSNAQQRLNQLECMVGYKMALFNCIVAPQVYFAVLL